MRPVCARSSALAAALKTCTLAETMGTTTGSQPALSTPANERAKTYLDHRKFAVLLISKLGPGTLSQLISLSPEIVFQLRIGPVWSRRLLSVIAGRSELLKSAVLVFGVLQLLLFFRIAQPVPDLGFQGFLPLISNFLLLQPRIL